MRKIWDSNSIEHVNQSMSHFTLQLSNRGDLEHNHTTEVINNGN